MTSKQPVQTSTPSAAAVIPTSPAIKDSPAVERALNRSKLYLLVSWSLLYPEDDEFLDYVQCGEFVEDGRAAIDALDVALDALHVAQAAGVAADIIRTERYGGL